MQQLFFVKKNKLEWRETKPPVIENGTEAIVRPFAVAKCDLDDFYLFDTIVPKLKLGKLLGLVDPKFVSVFAKMFTGPFPFGHECVAEVIETGDKVRHIKVGDVVSVPFQLSCGTCTHCQKGITSACMGFPAISTYGFGKYLQFGGAMSDLLKVPYADAMLLKIPDHIDPIHLASLSDNVPDAYRAVGTYLEEDANKSVLIIGGRPRSIGLYCVLIAAAMGAPEITFVDAFHNDLDIARKLGAQQVYTNIKDVKGTYDIVVEASSSRKNLAEAVIKSKPYGLVASVGLYPLITTMPLVDMYTKGIHYKTGLTNARTEAEKVLALIEHGKLDLKAVTSKHENWDNAIDAFLSRSSKVIVSRNRLISR